MDLSSQSLCCPDFCDVGKAVFFCASTDNEKCTLFDYGAQVSLDMVFYVLF